MLLLLLACAAGDASDTADTNDTSTCVGDLAAGEAVALAEGFAEGTEGVAFAGGSLFVSSPDGVSSLGARGEVSLVTALTHALGLAPTATGVLVADPGEFTFDGSGDDGRLLHVAPDGLLTVVAFGMPNPNFVLAGPDGEILVSDDTAAIYAVRDGGVSTWLDAVPSPNGMGYAPDGSAIYVVSTFEPEPPLWKVPLVDGEPGTPEVVTTFETGSAPDGLAVDAAGGVWVALNLANELVRVDPATGEETHRVSGVTNPASLAFGAGEGFDPCSLYVTELFGDKVWRVATGVPGSTVPLADAP